MDPTPQRSGEPDAADLPRADRLLALLGQPPLAAPGETVAPPPAIATATPATASAARHATAGAAEPTVVAKGIEPAVENVRPDPKAMDPIVERETANQSQLNVAEFAKRQKIADAQANFAQEVPATISAPGSQAATAEPPPAEPPPANLPPEAAESAENAPAAVGVMPVAVTPVVIPSSRRPPARPRRRSGGPTGVVRALFEPVWVDGRLLLVRRVVRDGAEGLQGLLLDPGATRKWLLDEVTDLLPAARPRAGGAGGSGGPGAAAGTPPLAAGPRADSGGRDGGPLPGSPRAGPRHRRDPPRRRRRHRRAGRRPAPGAPAHRVRRRR